MNNNHFRFFTLFFLLISGCNSRPTITTSVASSTTIMTPTYGPTVEKTNSPMQVSLPTLGLEQSKDVTLDLMANNAGCSEPCFWGLKPGTSSISESVGFIAQFRRKVNSGKQGATNYYIASLPYLDDLIINLILWEKDGILDSLNVDIGSVKNQITVEDLMAFTPNKIMEKYGPPSRISFFLSYPTELPASDNVGYGYTLYYKDFIVQYQGQRVPAKPLVHVCPLTDTGLEGTKIWLGENPKDPPPDGVDLEIATSLAV